MPRKRSSVRDEPPDLFRPRPTRPVWQALPDGVQQEVRALLVQLLHPDAEGGGPRRAAGEGVTDE